MGLQHFENAKVVPSAEVERTIFNTVKKVASNSFSNLCMGPNGGGGPTGKSMPIAEPNAFTTVDVGGNGKGGPEELGGLDPVSATFKTGPNGGAGPSEGKMLLGAYGSTPDPRGVAMDPSNHGHNKVNTGPGGGTGPSGKAMGGV
jgi:hypothetical protein